MATKANPGPFDCYGKAGPHEQIFTLREVDPLAPFLVAIWSKYRRGDPVAAQVLVDSMKAQLSKRYIAEPDIDKADEAMDIALAMWRAQAIELGIAGNAC